MTLTRFKDKYNLNKTQLAGIFGVNRPVIYEWLKIEENGGKIENTFFRTYMHLRFKNDNK